MARSKVYRVQVQKQVLVERCLYSPSAAFRMKGLLGRGELAHNEAILLKPANQIHMFFMKFPIDAIFLDSGNTVVHICHEIRPWRVSPLIGKAEAVLECAGGLAGSFRLELGHQLDFETV